MAAYIEPRVLKGFRDFLPAQEIERRNLTEKIETIFRSFGFVPIDTPALEYTEILLGKGGGETEKQVYRFKDAGGRDIALRFDLTVPFARFIAGHRSELPLPFKRYHIAKVWRGENTQRGRYREFTQCDFDIVGSESPAADFEILLMIQAVLSAVGAGSIKIRLNHRGLFNRFLASIDAAEHSTEILRTVDKLSKIGRDETASLLRETIGGEKAEKTLEFIEAGVQTGGKPSAFEDTLNLLEKAAGGPCPESERLRVIHRFMADTGTEGFFVLDPSITRGLDYYTGIVFETFLDAIPEIGSVCSGGRYDNLAGLYSKENISGVGSSVGLDRLIAALETLGRSAAEKSYSRLVIACADEMLSGSYQALANRFRARGIACEVLLETGKAVDGKALTRQYILAEKKGAKWLAVPGADVLSGRLTLRNLEKRENHEGISFDEAATLVKD
ncbi:MAG: histidine--tRNA ligase [Treponema sp.]|jgi:histidyl-tRNA synthetase|nr:histidine--tRNA ligase [Treponema sp.]